VKHDGAGTEYTSQSECSFQVQGGPRALGRIGREQGGTYRRFARARVVNGRNLHPGTRHAGYLLG
jgi:hypothetical protein